MDILIGVLFALVAAFSWGLNAHILKYGMKNENAMLAMFFRAIIAAPLAALIAIIIYGVDAITVYFSSEVIPLVIISVIFILLGDGIFLYALKTYPVKMLLPIGSTYPLITTTILLVTGVETISPMIITGTVIIITGVAVVTYAGNSETEGEFDYKIPLIGFSAAICWGIAVFTVRMILQFDGTEGFGLTAIRTFIMAIASIIIFLSSKDARTKHQQRESTDKKSSLKYLTLSGIVGWVIGASAFMTSIQKVGASIATPISSINPIIAVLFGTIAGIEKITKLQFTGILITVIGTVVIVLG